MSHYRSGHWDLGAESSLDCSSSSSDTDSEISKLREESRRLRKVAKHYRRKYLNAKERCRDVSNLNMELQRRLFETTPIDVPSASMGYIAQDENDDYEEESKVHNMFMEYVPAQEPVCELTHEETIPSEQILSEEKLRTASCVRSGQAGDSLFVKNLALAIWGAKTLASRSVTGKRCMAIKHSVAKPPLSPKKVEYIKEKFIERIRRNEPHVSWLEMNRRVGKIRVYIADKIATLNRRSTLKLLDSNS